jgi:hypothetical protein
MGLSQKGLRRVRDNTVHYNLGLSADAAGLPIVTAPAEMAYDIEGYLAVRKAPGCSRVW